MITGVGGGHDLDLHRLAADGVILLGRVLGGQNGRLTIAPDLGENLGRGDESLIDFTQRVDEHVARNGLEFPPSKHAEVPYNPKEVADPILTLDLAAAGISSIIWANGFRYDFNWIDPPRLCKRDTVAGPSARAQARDHRSARGVLSRACLGSTNSSPRFCTASAKTRNILRSKSQVMRGRDIFALAPARVAALHDAPPRSERCRLALLAHNGHGTLPIDG